MKVDFGGGADVTFFRQGRAGIISLSRARALNCLNQTMTRAIARALQAWRDDSDVALVLIEGEGRAFCAGGDVVEVWRTLQAGEDARPFFDAEYRLNSLIGHFPKPCISYLDGFVMGGGHCDGEYRVCHAGGGDWLLSRCWHGADFGEVRAFSAKVDTGFA